MNKTKIFKKTVMFVLTFVMLFSSIPVLASTNEPIHGQSHRGSYTIKDGVLKYDDGLHPDEYELKVEVGEGVTYEGAIYSDGKWTEIVDANYDPIRWFLMPGYPQCFQFRTTDSSMAYAQLIPSDAGSVRRVQAQPGTFAVDLNKPATIKVTKGNDKTNFMNTIESYITMMQWVQGTTQFDHYFDKTPSATDAAVVTFYERDFSEYMKADGTGEIPYDVFVAEAKKVYETLPDMKKANAPDVIYYDAAKNAFVRPYGGFGSAPYEVEISKIETLASGIYAIRFKVAKETIDIKAADFKNPQDYTECTIAVKDNGEGGWTYLGYQPNWIYVPEIAVPAPQPETPAPQPETPAPQPETPGNVTVTNPDKNQELSQNTVQKAVAAVENSKTGETVNVEMNGATKAPATVLEAAKGKDVNVVFDMGNYKWTINGKDVSNDALKDIDLGVIVNANVIPEATVNKTANGNESIQISLAHDGNFGYAADLNLIIGKEFAGKTVSLYYYNEKGEMKLVDKAVVAEDGTATFTFTHASDYLAVVEGTAKANIPATGDMTQMAVYIMLIAMAACTTLVVIRKRKEII